MNQPVITLFGGPYHGRTLTVFEWELEPGVILPMKRTNKAPAHLTKMQHFMGQEHTPYVVDKVLTDDGAYFIGTYKGADDATMAASNN